MYPIICGLIFLWMRLFEAYFIKIDKRNMFVQHGRHRHKQVKVIPNLNIKLFTTKANYPEENTFSWDTDGIPFIVDNSATGIIRNVRKLFVFPLSPTRVTLEIAEGLKTSTKYVGTVRLVLTDNVNKHHAYYIPECVYYP